MAEAEGDYTIADKALEAGKKAASVATDYAKKATNYAAAKISTAEGSTLIKIMRYADIVLGIALILCYPIGIFTGNTVLSFTCTFMMVYCIVFSCLLIFFETGLGKWEGFIRKYFGFMYSYTGRTVFTLFTVSMVFGQGDSNRSVYLLNTIVGIIGFVVCIFNCFVVCKHPAFQKGGEYYSDASTATQGVSEAPAKKATPAPAKKAAPSYEDNPFDSSSDDDMPSASVPGAKKQQTQKPKKQQKKKSAVVDNPFEDDNPFDD